MKPSFSVLLGLIIASEASRTLRDSKKETSIEKLTVYCESLSRNENSEEPMQAGEIPCLPKDEQPQACFVLWNVGLTAETKIDEMKGCIPYTEDCNQTKCIDFKYSKAKKSNFCCCNQDMCNVKFLSRHDISQPSNNSALEIYHNDDIGQQIVSENVRKSDEDDIWIRQGGWSLVSSFLGGCLVSITVYVIFIVYRSQQRKRFDLLRIKSNGRFGTMRKVNIQGTDFAVKIFSAHGEDSWLNETNIYQFTLHANILQFIKAEERSYLGGKKGFWLYTQFHTLGSLHDHLKSRTIDETTLNGISQSMARGLNYLHTEITTSSNEIMRIAHLDFSSKNVFVKDDLTACIGNFEFALNVDMEQDLVPPRMPERNIYCAPEILRVERVFGSILKIDIYAFGLVLWELVSRCTLGEIYPYRLPFELPLGSHPTLEELQANIVDNRIRPWINPKWRDHPRLRAICVTIEECWDHDQEARLSSSDILIRLS